MRGSTNSPGSYAQYYSFTLSTSTSVVIDLESGTDTYMYFWIESDDDAGDGYNSCIEITLPSGTYTIEATTFNSGEIGSFTLTLRGDSI